MPERNTFKSILKGLGMANSIQRTGARRSPEVAFVAQGWLAPAADADR